MYQYVYLAAMYMYMTLSLTSAVDKDSSSLIETRIEVGLKGSNVLGQMNKLVQVCPNIDEAWKEIHV